MSEPHTSLGQWPDEITALPTWLLNKAARAGHRLVQAEFEAQGISHPHYFAVLVKLDERGALTQADLVNALGIDASNMVDAINELEEASLVSRAPDPDDRRRNRVRLTAKGRRRLPALRASAERANAALVAGLTRTQRVQLVALLRELVLADPKGSGARRARR